MSMDAPTRHRFRALLNEWQRGVHDLEDLYDLLSDLVGRGVNTQTPPPADQPVAPAP